MISPRLALLAWIPITLYIFRRFSVRTAILIGFLGGWAILPTAQYTPTGAAFPYWILSSNLSTNYFLTKATATGLACLLGVLLFDRGGFDRFELSFWDLPMVAWSAVPLFSGVANPERLSEGLRGEIYQLLAWGVPYFLGRLYFSDTESLRQAAKALVIAGLAYVPICLIEVFTGPQLYTLLYGYQPYRWTEAHRYLGFRPIGLLENGNQLGIWMATSALIATWLWKRRSVDRVLNLPIAWVAALLFAVTLLCQSGGSIILLFGLLPFIFVHQRYLPRIVAGLFVFGILTFAGLRLSNAVSLRTLVAQNTEVHAAAHFLNRIQRGSLTWRLEQDEGHVNEALRKPILGSGAWDWWRDAPMRPWGLWMLTFGMYGLIGLLALECLQLLPVARVVWFPLARSDIEAFNLRHALAAAILMSAIDNLLNGAMILPLLVVIGGMSTWTSAASEVRAAIQARTEPDFIARRSIVPDDRPMHPASEA
jgi:hypothetical protein